MNLLTEWQRVSVELIYLHLFFSVIALNVISSGVNQSLQI